MFNHSDFSHGSLVFKCDEPTEFVRSYTVADPDGPASRLVEVWWCEKCQMVIGHHKGHAVWANQRRHGLEFLSDDPGHGTLQLD